MKLLRHYLVVVVILSMALTPLAVDAALAIAGDEVGAEVRALGNPRFS